MQSTLLIIIIGLYLLMLPVIGIIGRRMSQERTLRDFLSCWGWINRPAIIFTLYATQYSGNTLFGFAGNAYREGPVIFFAAARHGHGSCVLSAVCPPSAGSRA